MKTLLQVTVLIGTLLLAAAAVVTAAPGETFPDVTSDGGWCWFADPRAVTRDGHTYTGWVTEGGSVQAAAIEHSSGKVTTVDLHSRYERDDHDAPSFLFLQDGRLMAFYSKHCGPDMNARVTKRPGDITEWEPERTLELYDAGRSRKNITYSNPMMLADETNAIYLFWRGDTWKPTFSKSTDNGQTWSPGKIIVARKGAADDNRPYVKVSSNGRDRIHLVFTDGHPQNETRNSVYYACYKGGAFYRADGSRTARVDELPFTPQQADCVYNARKAGVRAWVWDVAEDKNGRPVIAYTRIPSETDHRYHYACWDGEKWNDNELCAGGSWFPQTKPGQKEREPYYSGGLAIDHADASVVYLSRPVNGVREIERWATADGGKSWKSEAVTAGSKHDNVRPVVIQNHTPDGPTVLWMSLSGRYAHYTDYRTSIKCDLLTPKIHKKQN